MSVAQRVLYNTVAQVAGKAVLFLATLITVRLTTSYLGIERYGEYAIVLAFAPILLAVADLGIGTLLARELAKEPHRADQLGGALLAFRLAGSAGVFALCAAVVPLLPYSHEVKVGIVIAAAGVVAASIGNFALPFFQVNLRLDLAALLDVVTALLTVSLIAAVTHLDLGFYALVGAPALAAAVNLGLALVLSARYWRPGLRFDRPLARTLLRDAVPLALVVILGLLHFRIDAVLLSLLKPAADVGIYNVAYRFLEQSLILPGLFMAAVFPIVTAALARGGSAEAVIRKAFEFLLLLAVPLAIVLAVLAEPLVRLVATSEFDASARPLRILSGALVFAFGNTIFAGVLLALSRQRALVVVSAVGLTANVALNLLLIPLYGYTAAAATTVLSEAVGAGAVFLLARRAYSFTLDPGFLWRLAIAAVAMGAVALVLARAPLLVALAAAGATFAVAAYALGLVTRADLALLLPGAQR